MGDAQVIELELALADLETARRAAERLTKKARVGDKDAQLDKTAVEKAVGLLEQGAQLRAHPWTDRERQALRPLCLMTLKPMLYVANVADDDLAGEGAWAQALKAHAESQGCGWIPICGDLELELRNLDEEDRALFMEELGVEELGLGRLIQAVYRLLGLQTYFTAGEKEVRAWTVRSGSKAPAAAGVIHSDFEKGFIRAEVYSVDDLKEVGSESAIKAAGRMRTEGRDYVMREGDVCHFLVGK